MKMQNTNSVRASISFPVDVYKTLEELAQQNTVSLAWCAMRPRGQPRRFSGGTVHRFAHKPEFCKCYKGIAEMRKAGCLPAFGRTMAGTTGLEPAASAVTGQRSNQLNYVPSTIYALPWEHKGTNMSASLSCAAIFAGSNACV